MNNHWFSSHVKTKPLEEKNHDSKLGYVTPLPSMRLGFRSKIENKDKESGNFCYRNFQYVGKSNITSESQKTV